MRLRIPLFSLALFAASLSAHADARLASIFGDNMVLQRDQKLPVWGWASPGEAVSVQLDSQSAVSTTADTAGKWRVELPAQKADGKARTLTVKANNTLTLKDVLVGEVWLCSGQSNMEWSVAASANPQEEIAAANYPTIRHIKVPLKPASVPQDEFKASWQVCSPQTAGSFTAAGYFMARKLQKELGVPIGLINSSWGGTRIEPWTPVSGFADVPAVKDIHNQVVKTLPDSPLYQQKLKQHLEAVDKWSVTAREALAANRPVPVTPVFPPDFAPLTNHQSPTTLFNAMINPFVGFPIRGAIWYQGESNHGEGMLYTEKMKALIQGWRKIWGIGEFPFLYVQIAPYKYGAEDPNVLATFWEAQSAAQAIPNTGMVVTTDIANLNDIHPKNKQDVGLRLALLALKNTYGKSDVVANGPKFKSIKPEGDKLRVTFENTAGGLKSRDQKPLTWFEIIGPETDFTKADAVIEGDSVVLSSPNVKNPVAMRFAWHKDAEPNLANGAGLPAETFRAGEVPKIDYLTTKVSEAAGYKLVYDLDLAKLGANIKYDVDNSASLKGEFDRVAYFLELRGPQGVTYSYVSMDTFTTDIKKIGIPTVASGAKFQTLVKNANVISNLKDIPNGTFAGDCNIEFWPNNYGPLNAGKVAGASDTAFDTGDMIDALVDGYGSMQIHNFKAKQTLFAINNWKAAANANIGIGNSTGDTKDWTFVGNASSYGQKRLRVLVRMK
ncbi:MAG: sialate O-acetylesterase [Verrucomicrobia bacterium]|jgi:sialate O-acetylesterase|nr:sialate O-acetylesterase [Verrucomicrobiota bacterium]